MRAWVVLVVLLTGLLMAWVAHQRSVHRVQHSFVYLRDSKVHNLSKTIPDKPGTIWDNGGMLVYQEK